MIVQKLRAVRVHPPDWWRGEARSEGDWIVLDAARAELYQPISEPGLLFDMADIRRPDDAVAFVRGYGLLRHGPGSEETREPFSDFLDTSMRLYSILRVYRAIRSGVMGGVDELPTLRAFVAGLAPLFDRQPETDQDLLSAASEAVAFLVSDGLVGVELRLDSDVEWGVGPHGEPGRPDGFRLAPEPPDLVGVAYHALALHLSLKAPVAVCAECGRHFPHGDPRQRFCTPTCAMRARRRRWRERHPLPAHGATVEP